MIRYNNEYFINTKMISWTNMVLPCTNVAFVDKNDNILLTANCTNCKLDANNECIINEKQNYIPDTKSSVSYILLNPNSTPSTDPNVCNPNSFGSYYLYNDGKGNLTCDQSIATFESLGCFDISNKCNSCCMKDENGCKNIKSCNIIPFNVPAANAALANNSNNVVMNNSNMANSNRANSNIANSNRPNSNMPNSNMPNSNMPNSNIANSNIANSNMPNSNMPNSNRVNSNIANSNRPNSNMPNSNMPNSNMPNSNIANSNMPNSNTQSPTSIQSKYFTIDDNTIYIIIIIMIVFIYYYSKLKKIYFNNIISKK